MSVRAEEEVSLEDLLGDLRDHLACACRPKIMFCGKYIADVEAVDILDSDDNICPGCANVWYKHGCLNCSCGPGAICQACVQSAAN